METICRIQAMKNIKAPLDPRQAQDETAGSGYWWSLSQADEIAKLYPASKM